VTTPARPRHVEAVCPRCHGQLTQSVAGDFLGCGSCESRWPITAGIPDFRTTGDPFLTIDEDRAAAVRLTVGDRRPFAAALASYYEGNALVPESQARAIIRATLAAPTRSRAFLTMVERLLSITVGPAYHVLDIGAGTGPLTVELARASVQVWGVDVGLRWIALARARAHDAGVPIDSCTAGLHALPFPDASFDFVLGESVLELVTDHEQALCEVRRVLRPGAFLALATPNRWSPGPDPHLGLPLTSWLPQRAVSAVARLRGILPPKRTLLGHRDLRRLFELTGFRTVAIEAQDLPETLGEGSPAWLRAGIAAFRLASRTPGLAALAQAVSPVLVAIAQRAETTAP